MNGIKADWNFKCEDLELRCALAAELESPAENMRDGQEKVPASFFDFGLFLIFWTV